MSSQPECRKCGDYVHSGLVVCEECSGILADEMKAIRAENARLTADVYETSRVMLVQADALNRILKISNDPVVLEIAQKAIDEKWEPAKDGE